MSILEKATEELGKITAAISEHKGQIADLETKIAFFEAQAEACQKLLAAQSKAEPKQ